MTIQSKNNGEEYSGVAIVFDCMGGTAKVEINKDAKGCDKAIEFALALEHFINHDQEFLRMIVSEHYMDIKPENGFTEH